MERPYVASALNTRRLLLVYDDGWRCEWPIQYWDGRIAYDWPERIPRAARRLVERAFNAARTRDLAPCPTPSAASM